MILLFYSTWQESASLVVATEILRKSGLPYILIDGKTTPTVLDPLQRQSTNRINSKEDLCTMLNCAHQLVVSPQTELTLSVCIQAQSRSIPTHVIDPILVPSVYSNSALPGKQVFSLLCKPNSYVYWFSLHDFKQYYDGYIRSVLCTREAPGSTVVKRKPEILLFGTSNPEAEDCYMNAIKVFSLYKNIAFNILFSEVLPHRFVESKNRPLSLPNLTYRRVKSYKEVMECIEQSDGAITSEPSLLPLLLSYKTKSILLDSKGELNSHSKLGKEYLRIATTISRKTLDWLVETKEEESSGQVTNSTSFASSSWRSAQLFIKNVSQK
jgi:hypothetical protein